MLCNCTQHIIKEILLLLKDSLEHQKIKIYKYMTLVSRNVYIDKLNDIVNKYNNTYHSTIKMKSIDVKSNTCINSHKKLTIKIINLKLVTLLEYQNIKIFLLKVTFQIGPKTFLLLKS